MFQVTQISRRRFLTYIGLVAGVSAAGVLPSWRIGQLASRIYKALTEPELQDTPGGVLDEQAVQGLLATTTALLPSEVETQHYAEFFRWRAENLRGYRSLYEGFAVVVDTAAQNAAQTDFASCELSVRRQILQGLTARTYALIFQREELRFEKYIFQEILALFSKTDAWVWLGYEAWPGTPRGLQVYTKAPRKT